MPSTWAAQRRRQRAETSRIQIQIFEEVRKATSKMKQEQKVVQTNQLEIPGMKMVKGKTAERFGLMGLPSPEAAREGGARQNIREAGQERMV